MSTETTSTQSTSQLVNEHFSKKWFSDGVGIFDDDLYRDLVARLDDINHQPVYRPLVATNRSYAACRYVLDHLPPGAKLLDMACGIGFISHAMTIKGYDCRAFDISDAAIERARRIARSLGQDESHFTAGDENVLPTYETGSFDVVLAMGYLRYLTPEQQEFVYAQVRRVLKPGGLFIIVHQNVLFEMFAMNDGTLKFWAETIESFSDAPKLLQGMTVLEALQSKVTVPTRKFSSETSQVFIDAKGDNPLTIREEMPKRGFEVLDIMYPNSHLMPPMLEAMVDADALNRMKSEVPLQRMRDWRAMFFEYEFLGVNRKV